LLREGIEPEIVEYVKTPYTAAQLKRVLGQLHMPASRLLRKKEAAAAGIEALGRRAHRGDAREPDHL
jgi:arsenate reductase-like glutaredoxin family protein